MLTPRQLIDLCRDTSQPLPSGRKIAEVVEGLVEENEALMAPPVVTDAMVERAMSVLPRHTVAGSQEMVGRAMMRAVLEAAKKEYGNDS